MAPGHVSTVPAFFKVAGSATEMPYDPDIGMRDFGWGDRYQWE